MNESQIIVAAQLTCILAASGCASRNHQPQDPAAQNQMVVKIGHRTMSSVQPAVLDIVAPEGQPSVGELSLSIENELSLVVNAPYSSFPTFQAVVLDEPGSSDSPYATVIVNGKQVSEGVVKVSVAGGRISGGLDNLDLTFSGEVAISCSVPPSRLPSDTEAPKPSDMDARVLVVDAEFKTDECATVKAALF